MTSPLPLFKVRFLPVQIRWLIRRDMDEILAIEAASFEFPWTEEKFLACLRQRNAIGCVAESHGQILGFMIYELYRASLRILNFAVAPEYKRRKIGSQMFERLVEKLSQQRRHIITAEVRESNLVAQMFLSDCGMRAASILRQHYRDTTEDAIVFRYWIPTVELQEAAR